MLNRCAAKALSMAPSDVFGSLHHRFRELDLRLQKMEAHVTSTAFDIDRELAQGTSLGSITRHMLGLFAGRPGARAWRRYISEHAHREGAGKEVLINAINAMPAAA